MSKPISELFEQLSTGEYFLSTAKKKGDTASIEKLTKALERLNATLDAELHKIADGAPPITDSTDDAFTV